MFRILECEIIPGSAAMFQAAVPGGHLGWHRAADAAAERGCLPDQRGARGTTAPGSEFEGIRVKLGDS